MSSVPRLSSLLVTTHAVLTCFLTSPAAGQQHHQQREATTDYSQYVNPFVGTTGGGNMFPGVVAAPFAVVKFGPDVVSGTSDAYSGYLPDGRITGFSLTHESGTGGAPKYGVVAQLPVAGEVANPLVDLSTARAAADKATVGYYRSDLAGGLTVELAATEHAGMYSYIFPLGKTPSVVVDVSHVLPSFRGLGWGQEYSRGKIEVFEDGHYEGGGTYRNGWNLAPNWDIYFCGRFSEQQPPVQSKTFVGTGTTLSEYGQRTAIDWTSDRVGAVFTFEANVSTAITSRVAVSFISSEKACQFLDEEIPEGTQLQTLVDKAKAKWNQDVFSKITTTSTDQTMLSLLYGSLYGMHLIPSNRTGENPHWQSDEPYYDDIFTFWDLFRCSTALMHILNPKAYEEQIRSLIDIWRHDGYLPDGRSSNFNGRTQGGSNADNVLADAFVKGVRGGINWEDGFAAMVTDAETVPANNNDAIAPDSSTKEGRGALPDWLTYGYITPTYSRAVSRAVEYACNDFALTQVAKGLGKTAEHDHYLNRSRNWRNHWNAAASSHNHSGFLVPRRADGSFVDQDPLSCGGCYWGDAYYQGLPWEYSMNAHHDMAELIARSGGRERFVDRLELMFQADVISGNGQFNHTIFNPGNEPSFTTPYLYNFAGRQDLAVLRSRAVARAYYSTGTGGIPGNSDAGAMQTWLLWNMLGLYPLTGQTTFLVGSPWFDDATIDLGDGKQLRIRSTRADGGSSDTAFFVRSLRVNGVQWDQSWITWEDVFAHGGALDFELSSDANEGAWAAAGAAPPSPASAA